MASGRSLERSEAHYYGAGPALMPTEVLQQAAYDIINYCGEGVGVGEISHRSKLADDIINNTKKNIADLLSIPDNYEVFFMQGGGTTGFSSVATNLSSNFYKQNGDLGIRAKPYYIVNGTWSLKSFEEAKRLGLDAEVYYNVKQSNGKFDDYKTNSNKQLPKLNKDQVSYLYYCDNETVNGIEFPEPPKVESGINIVCDMSSNFLSKKVDVSKYGLIFAGAQKNVGLAGLTIYIIRKDLISQLNEKIDEEKKIMDKYHLPITPIANHFPTVIKNNSAYNTIPIFTLYILKLVTDKLIAEGGLENQQKLNNYKSEILYGVLDKYPKLFDLPVNTEARSNMNVVFRINGDGLESKFIEEAKNEGFTGLKGHRSVGGCRVSIYNAISKQSVEKLVAFIDKFAASQ
ncbi:O-phospho-L-serine:2-oxoglutarate transaminase [Ascoidea rubescens DSM 1968]|uniref:phosphoserine transaminase n=1 Tax=Ascoidea rubescens DSM 1968 TaxID=1344418 RepID=A0A1D2VFC0_9ASCO|nr:3-phosphoserine aminotransferase [Ascoidea rubescens DSM 1968]ODV60378.1 3-phosphoserine aminotransferase [Ascoidea rubescens DSM 1968]